MKSVPLFYEVQARIGQGVSIAKVPVHPLQKKTLSAKTLNSKALKALNLEPPNP